LSWAKAVFRDSGSEPVTDEEAVALLSLLDRAINDDRYPLSPRFKAAAGVSVARRRSSEFTAGGCYFGSYPPAGQLVIIPECL
jgi:hypothetical protein